MTRRHALQLCALGLAASAAPAATQTLAIAAASDLQYVLPALAGRFERQTGRAVRLTFGSSGNFYSQIRNGAPFDVFLSADIYYPKRLQADGLTDGAGLYQYAVGRIVVWARHDAGVDVRHGLQVLVDSKVHRVAIANPEHAPYGRAAVEALGHEALYESVRRKLVLGENVSQAAQFVESGNAEAGIIALSVARSPALRAVGTYYEIPATWHAPLDQAAVVLKASHSKEAARAFLAFLMQPDSVRTMQDSGFIVPQAAGRK